jgi:Protein of unknown function (DUF4232)
MSEESARMPGGGDDAVPLCGADDLAVVVHWQHDGSALRGQVIAENVGARACRLANKPGVTPLRPDGSPLPVSTAVTLEMLAPGYVVLEPGERAAAPVYWGSWCGQQAADRARVDWPGGSAVAEVRGPAQPACVRGRSGNLTSSWFHLLR